jgi:hypothetical protein
MASTPRRMNKSERQRPGGGADQIAQPTGRGSGAWRPASGHTARASARLAKTSSFRHSSRRRPLKLSTKPFGSACPARCLPVDAGAVCSLQHRPAGYLRGIVAEDRGAACRAGRMSTSLKFRLARRQRVQGHSAPQEASYGNQTRSQAGLLQRRSFRGIEEGPGRACFECGARRAS